MSTIRLQPPLTPCRPGFFGRGGRDCKKCPVGFRAASAGQRKCRPCPPGLTSNPSRTRCVKKPTKKPCPKGFFGKGAPSCKKCPPRGIAPRPGRKKCKICPPGKIANPNRTKCIYKKQPTNARPCPAGTFGTGRPRCKRCPPGTITARPGRRRCVACPLGKKPNPKRTGCVNKKAKCAKKGWICNKKRRCCAGRRCVRKKGVSKCV